MRVLIFGITGQDGSYLAESLASKGIEVHGVIRKSATGNLKNIEQLLDSRNPLSSRVTLHHGDLNDHQSVFRIIQDVQPNKIFNEADQDHVTWSTEIPIYSFSTTTLAVINILEAIRMSDKSISYFQPLSSNIFGGHNSDEFVHELSATSPLSPYAIAKNATFELLKFYRRNYNLRIFSGIFFNHESPRRPVEYVSRKITLTCAKIKLGQLDEIKLGDIDAQVDWGFAKEYMDAAQLIMESDQPDDFLIGTGVMCTVRSFLETTFNEAGLDPYKYLSIDPKLVRKSQTRPIRGDFSKAFNSLGFAAQMYASELAKYMYFTDFTEQSNLISQKRP